MHDAPPATRSPGERRVPPQLLRFLSRLGHVLLSTGDAVSVIEEVLRRIALAQGAQRVNIIAFPTVLFVKFEDGDVTCLDFTGSEGLTLRFDQTENAAPDRRISQLGPSAIGANKTPWPCCSAARATDRQPPDSSRVWTSSSGGETCGTARRSPTTPSRRSAYA